MTSKLRVSEMDELTVKYLEKAIMIKEWGRLARAGLGLGYGACTLDDGRRGDPTMTIEKFEEITREINKLPERPRVVIISIYKLGNNVSETALKMSDHRRNIERHQRSALNILYGALCTRLTC